jgi:Ca2+-binding RTX toxin-like protein
VLTIVGDARGQLTGGEGDDTINGGSGNDAISGGGGDDVIIANNGNDVVEAGDGDDIVRGGRGKDIIVGGDGNDELRGGYSNDILLAGDGNDDVVGGRGNDLIVGVATHFDHDTDRLKMIRGIWNGGDSYENRVSELRDQTSGLLRAEVVTQSADDDALTGGEGLDLFFAGLAPEQQVLDLDAMEELFDQN